MKHPRIIIAMAVLLGAASLAEAQIVVSSTTATTIREKSGREKGIVIRPDLGIGWGVAQEPLLVEFSGTVAYQLNPYLAIGVGLGFDFDSYAGNTLLFLPVFVNARAYFCDRKWSPFLDIKIRYVSNINKVETYQYGYYSQTWVKGLSYGGTLGMQYKNVDFGLSGYFLDVHKELGGWAFTINVAYNFQIKKR